MESSSQKPEQGADRWSRRIAGLIRTKKCSRFPEWSQTNIAKDVMARIPSFSRWMRYMHCLFLDRSDIKKGMQTIKDAINLINNGISVHVCPEGTRNKTDEPLQEFHKGTFKIAERTGCTIIPITINNSESIYEKQRPRIVPSKVILEYGKPIETANLSRDEKKQLCENVREIILETYLKNQKLLEADK